jgi:hypothetical protein
MGSGVRRKATSGVTSRFRRLTKAIEKALGNPNIVSRQGHAPSVVESLEERRLLSTGVVINEFMADNNTGYVDPAFPGVHPDWIELYNPTTAAVNLQGWQLKDGGGSPSTWTFPAGATIAASGYLVVVADGQNLTNPAKVMHTNFSLNKDGEYLGLIKPDSTIANEFAPSYPPQSSDISYGITSQVNSLPFVGPTAVLKATVPANNSFDTANPNWKDSAFDDTGAAWLSGAGGVGFDSNPGGQPAPAGWNVHMVRAATGDFGSIVAAKNVLDGNLAGFTVASDNSVTAVNHIDYADGGHFAENNTLPDGGSVASGSASPLREEYAIRASAFVTIPAGTYTIGVNSDDGFQLTIPGVTFTTRLNENYTGLTSTPSQITYGGTRGTSDTLGTFTLTSALATTITADMFEQHGGDDFEVFIALGAKSSVDGTFSLLGNNTLGWSLTTAASNVPYLGQFGLNLQSQMLNVNPTAYVRIPFDIDADDLPAFSSMLLHMKYDDGFVAWINGVQVASANAPASPVFNSAATASNPNAQAVLFRDFNIPNAQNYIHAGLNVLAIQAMNVTAADADFLNVATLDGVTGSVDVPRFFAPATPGTANTGAFVDRVKDTKFDHDRGFYSAPFQLAITSADTANGATIKYTIDGSTPSATNGIVYAGPITINKTSTIRAGAFRNGYLPTDIDTQTYIFLTDVITQSASNSNTGTPPPGWPASWAPNTTDYGMDPDVVNNPIYAATIKNDLQTIPSLSVVTDLTNLFGSTGLYSNPGGSGIAWERPASLELINPDGSTGFQINAGLRLRGGYSRSDSNPKHGLRILLRDSYGSSTLDYPLFKSMDGSDTNRGFDIRTFENYSWSFEGNGAQFIGLRDQFSRDTQNAMGESSERGDMYNLYIDGQYWGIYNTDERPEADYASTYYGGTPDDYDTIKVDPQSGYTILATDGNTNAWNTFWNMANQLRAVADAGQDTNVLYQQMLGKNPDGTRNPAYPVYLDPNNLIDYMLTNFYTGSTDGPSVPNNFYILWNHTTKSMGFQYFAHDSEHSLLDVNTNNVSPITTGISTFNKSNPEELMQQLLYNPDFRTLAADRIHKFFFNNGALTTAADLARFNKRRDEINRAIVGESARWGDSKVATALLYTNWQGAIATVTNSFFPNRANTVLNQFKTIAMGDTIVHFTLYPAVNAPEFVEQFGGNFNPGFVAHLTNPGGVIYYTLDGSDPRLPGGAINPSALVYSAATGIPLSATVRIQARALSGGVWSAVTDATFTTTTPPAVRVTEVMYHPVDPPAGSVYSAKDFQYVEVQNISGLPINLNKFSLSDGITFTFPNIVLAAGARTVVASNLTAFQSLYGSVIPVAGTFSGNLSNGGEHVQFNGPLGETIQSFTYSDAWYPQTDGEGFSLVLRDPNQATSLSDNSLGWRASNSVGGDPDASVAAINPGSVVINELEAKVSTPNTTWIELANTTNAPIDISGWFLSNDSSALKKYQFPAGSIIAANGYLLLNEQTSYGQTVGNPAALVPFTLDGDGANTINLSQADGAGTLLGYREIQDYSAADVGQSLGRVLKSNGGTDFAIQKSPTPGAANTGPVVGPVVINEVMYGPMVTYTGATPNLRFPNPNLEYIELRNVTNAPVSLFDPANPADTYRLTDGVQFTFPTGVTIPAFGYVIVSNLLPGDFRTAYNNAYGANALPLSVAVYGPMRGFLNNTGEKVTLQRPGVPEAGGILPYITVDKLSYGNSAPWPTSPNQGGPSLVRKNPLIYGNDPTDWTASPQLIGSPGGDNLPNSPPVVTLAATTASVAEGTLFTLTGSFVDPDLGQTWPIQQVGWGDGTSESFTSAADNTFTLTHIYKDNAATTFNADVVILDNLNSPGVASIAVTVTNVAPTVAAIPDQNAGAPFALNYTTGSFTDPGTLDTFTATVDWDYHAGDTDAVPLTLNADKSFTLNHLFNTNGTYVVRVQVTDKDGGVGFTNFTVVVGDNTPPMVTSDQFLFASGPRKIAITFSEDVSASLQVDDLTVHNVDANTDLDSSAMTLSWDAASNTATWTFGALADANYHATLHAVGVTDAASNALAQDATLDFWFLNGDADRDRSVGFNDLVAVAQHYGAVSGGTLAGGDMDGDGAVGFSDLVTVAQNYGKTLAPLPAAIPASAPVAAAAVAAAAPVESAPVLASVAAVPAITPAAPVTTHTPPKPGGVQAKKASKPVVVVKPKSPPRPVPVSAFSTVRIGAETPAKKHSDLLD